MTIRLRNWRYAPPSRPLTLALGCLCAASLCAPPVLGHHYTHPIVHSALNLASDCLLIAAACTLAIMVTTALGHTTRPTILATVVVIAAMITTGLWSWASHTSTPDGILAGTGPGPTIYIVLYGAAITFAGLRLLQLTLVFARFTRGNTELWWCITAPFTTASVLLALYGIDTANFISNRHGEDLVPLIHITRIEMSWHLATATMIILAIAGAAGPLLPPRRRSVTPETAPQHQRPTRRTALAKLRTRTRSRIGFRVLKQFAFAVDRDSRVV